MNVRENFVQEIPKNRCIRMKKASNALVLCAAVVMWVWCAGCEPPSDVVSDDAPAGAPHPSQPEIDSTTVVSGSASGDDQAASAESEPIDAETGSNSSRKSESPVISMEDSPAVAVAPKMVYFESGEPGQVSDNEVTIYNFGKGPLTLVSILLETESVDLELLEAPKAGSKLGPGQEISVVVRYSPSDVGPDSGKLTIATDDPTTPVIGVSLTAKTGCFPEVSVLVDGKKGNSVSFDPELSDSRVLELHNKGGCDLTVEKLYFENHDLTSSMGGGLWAEIQPGDQELLDIGLWEDEWSGEITLQKGKKLPVVVHFRPVPGVSVQNTYLFLTLGAGSIQSVPVGIPILFGK